jgi:hypothetical protein
MKRIFIISVLIILPFIQNRVLFSQESREEAWTFTGKDTLCLESFGSTKFIISGSESDEMKVKLNCISNPDEYFEVIEKEKTIYLKENILNYDIHRPTQTYFKQWTWIINVPRGTNIKCTGSSGDFEVNNFIGSFRANYGSGSFNFDKIDGSIELSLAVLNAKIHHSKGSFNLSSASGTVRAKGLTIEGNSSFSTGMGNIKISLAREPEANLYVGSNFNRAQVRYNNHPLTGYFKFIAMAGGGRIISPYNFDKEETFLDDIKNYRDSSDFGRKSEYIRKSFIRGNSKPEVIIKTVTGTAQLIR